MTTHRRRTRALGGGWALAASVLLGTVASGCGELLPGDRGTIDDETFIEVYVELRMAALQSPGMQIQEEDRDRILREHDVEEEDLVRFVETHGADIHRMSAVWQEASDLLSEKREAAEEEEMEDVPPAEGVSPEVPPGG